MTSPNSSSPPSCCKCCCSLILTLGLTTLIYWAIFQPHYIRAYINTATLSNFNLSNPTTSSSNSLEYNFNVTISLHNPNGRIGIYYDKLFASAFYGSLQMGESKNFEPFYQHKKESTVIYRRFDGKGEVGKEASGLFGKERSESTYNLEVRLNGKLRYKMGFVKVNGFKPKISCWLKFLVANNGSFEEDFNLGRKCHVKY